MRVCVCDCLWLLWICDQWRCCFGEVTATTAIVAAEPKTTYKVNAVPLAEHPARPIAWANTH